MELIALLLAGAVVRGPHGVTLDRGDVFWGQQKIGWIEFEPAGGGRLHAVFAIDAADFLGDWAPRHASWLDGELRTATVELSADQQWLHFQPSGGSPYRIPTRDIDVCYCSGNGSCTREACDTGEDCPDGGPDEPGVCRWGPDSTGCGSTMPLAMIMPALLVLLAVARRIVR